MLERSTLRPSALREQGVGPAPFSCTSQRAPAAFTTCHKAGPPLAPLPQAPLATVPVSASCTRHSQQPEWPTAGLLPCALCGHAPDPLPGEARTQHFQHIPH